MSSADMESPPLAAVKTQYATSPRSPLQSAWSGSQTPPSPYSQYGLPSSSPSQVSPVPLRQTFPGPLANWSQASTSPPAVALTSAPQSPAATLNLLLQLQLARAQLEAQMAQTGLPALMQATNGALQGVHAGAANLAIYLKHFSMAIPHLGPPASTVTSVETASTELIQSPRVAAALPTSPKAQQVQMGEDDDVRIIENLASCSPDQATGSGRDPETTQGTAPTASSSGEEPVPSEVSPEDLSPLAMSFEENGDVESNSPENHTQADLDDEDGDWVANILSAPADSSLCELIGSLNVAGDFRLLPPGESKEDIPSQVLRGPASRNALPPRLTLPKSSICSSPSSPNTPESCPSAGSLSPRRASELATPPPSPGLQQTLSSKRLRSDLPPRPSPRKRRSWGALLGESKPSSSKRRSKIKTAALDEASLKPRLGLLDVEEYEAKMLKEEESSCDKNPVLRHLREITDLLPSDGCLDTEAVLAQATLYIRTLQRSTASEAAALLNSTIDTNDKDSQLAAA